MTSTDGNKAPAPALAVRELCVAYGERLALDGVTLSIAHNTVAGLLGPNGSGKSTLLAVVAGLRTPRSGEVRIFGEAPGPARRRRVGVVFQEQALDPVMTLWETLVLHGRLFGLGGNTLRRRAEALLERFGLASRRRDAVRTLSGGLRRRLELARALLPSPELLLLDEPTAGLDPDARRSFWQLLRSVREEGLTLLLATNDVLEAERECDTVAFLHHGRLVAQGTPTELKRGLKHDSVRVECVDSDGDGSRADALAQSIAGWPGVGDITSTGPVLHVTVDDVSTFVPRLFETDADAIRDLRIQPSTLEDAYFQIAGSSLQAEREQEAATA